MKNRRSVGAEPHAQKKMKEITGGGGERTTPVITACMSRSWKVEVCKKKKLTRRDDQSAISSKEHVKYEATQNLFVSYVPTRPLALDRQTITATESGTTAKHTAYISPKSLLGDETKQKNDAIQGRMHAIHWFLPWILSTYYDLRVAQLNNRRND